MMQDTEPTPRQHAVWEQYQQARRNAGRPAVVDIPALDLRRGDVLAGGGTLTSEISRHPSGMVAAEVDYRTVVAWESERLIPIYERGVR